MPATQDRIQVGCPGLDGLLGGGFARGELALVYGEAGTGKTTLVIQTAAACAEKGLKVIYVDADHSFTQQRFDQITGGRSARISELITLFFPENFSEQRRIVESLENYVSSRLGLVVVDSVNSLYRAAFYGADTVFDLNRDLSRQMAYLGELASAHNVACLITSQVHSRLTPETAYIEPVARRAVFHFPQLILKMKHTPKTGVKEIVLERIGGADVRRRSSLVSLRDTGLADAVV